MLSLKVVKIVKPFFGRNPLETKLKLKLKLKLIFFNFLKLTFYFLFHDSTRYSLYPRPKAWDIAAIGATKLRLDFHKNF